MSAGEFISTKITRRECLALGSLAIAGACGRRKSTGYPGYALIATAGDDGLGVVDLTGFELLRPIPLGAPPTAVLPGGPSGHSYVLTPSTGTIHVLDPALKVVRSRKLADEVSEVRLTSDGKHLVMRSGRSQELIQADAASLRVTRRYRLAAPPAGLDVPPIRYDGRLSPSYAAVSTGKHGTVEFFDLTTGQRSKAQLPGEPGALRFRADGERLLVANLQGPSLTALNTPSLEVIADLPLAMRPENLCFNFDQGQLFVSGAGMDGVAIVFPYTTLEVEQTVLAGRDPGIMACSANPAYLFVASNSGSDVSILDIQSRKVIGNVDTGQHPAYITITPDSQYALVLDGKTGVMAVIRIGAIQANMSNAFKMRYKAVASLFTMLPVGANPVHAAVGPKPA